MFCGSLSALEFDQRTTQEEAVVFSLFFFSSIDREWRWASISFPFLWSNRLERRGYFKLLELKTPYFCGWLSTQETSII